MTDRYQISGSTVCSDEFVDLAYRRVRPFLDQAGTSTRSLEHLMAEAYRQGMMDGLSVALEAKP